jgi:hypothetical protein
MNTKLHHRLQAGRRLAALTLGAVLFQAACSDRGPTADTGPVAGELVLALDTQSDVGAIQFTIAGRDIAAITAANPEDALFTRRASDGSFAVVVIGESLRGPLLRFRVSDVRAAGLYRTSIVAVADRESRVQASTEPYALSVSRATE